MACFIFAARCEWFCWQSFLRLSGDCCLTQTPTFFSKWLLKLCNLSCPFNYPHLYLTQLIFLPSAQKCQLKKAMWAVSGPLSSNCPFKTRSWNHWVSDLQISLPSRVSLLQLILQIKRECAPNTSRGSFTPWMHQSNLASVTLYPRHLVHPASIPFASTCYNDSRSELNLLTISNKRGYKSLRSLSALSSSVSSAYMFYYVCCFRTMVWGRHGRCSGDWSVC